MTVATLGARRRAGAARHPRRPTKPEDLLGRPCISTVFPSRALLPWEFEQAGRIVKILPSGPLTCMDSARQLRAAIDRLGFLLTFEGSAKDAIASGKLLAVLED